MSQPPDAIDPVERRLPKRVFWTAALLLVAGLLLRFWAIDHARFTGDESGYWAVSRQLATLEHAPMYGPEITGSAAHLPGPMYYYFMAIPQRLGASPRLGSGFVVLLHGLCAFLLFIVARAARGNRAGLIALAAVAFAPWDVLYADRIWGSCVVPIWGTVGLYAALKSRDDQRWQGVLVFVALVLPQLHLSTPVLWAACAALLLLRPPKVIGWRSIGVGLALTVLAYAHPLYGELTSGFANTKTILSKAGGASAAVDVMLTPIKVFGYAVLYATSDISYHFARGYWGGGFDDPARFATWAGWTAWFRGQGLVWGAAGLVSLGLAALAWLFAIIGVTRAAAQAVIHRRRDALDAGSALTLSLLAGLAGGSALMMFAKKGYFPHYANILMPMLLWPAVAGLDSAMSKAWLRVPAALAALVSMAAMLHSCVTYYLEVDSLNGLGATMAMVGDLVEEEVPVNVRFDHFHNAYAWSLIARHYYQKPADVRPNAPVTYRVRNGARHRGEPGDGGKRFGSVLLERTSRLDPKPKPGLRLSGRKAWREATVVAIDAEGVVSACRDLGDRCQYGENPWQHFGPELMNVAGRSEPILFMHPIAGSSVRATFDVPAGARRGVLAYALSDASVVSSNTTPVQVRLRMDDHVEATAAATNRRGLSRLPFTLTSTTRTVGVEIECPMDGARVFGFELELYE